MLEEYKLDSHVHITSPDVIAKAKEYAERDDYFKLLTSSPKNKFATAEEVVKELDESGLEQAIVFGFAFKDMGLCRETNDYVLEVIKKYPNRLKGFACVNPRSKNLEAELDRCLKGGMCGVGELFPQGQGFEIDHQEQVRELAGLCRERQLPVLIHTNESVGHYYPGKTATNVQEAYTFANNNQDLTIIFAHWGGGLCFYELMPELRSLLSNVYYDTAATPFLYSIEIYDAIKAAGLVDKILLGSDFPLLSPNCYLNDLKKSALTVEELKLITGRNAGKLLERSL